MSPGYNINQKDEGTWDDRGRDGGTNFILRIKEQETRLILHERDDDDVITSAHTANNRKITIRRVSLKQSP